MFNLTIIAVIAVVILGLGGAVAIEGKLLLNAHEQMADLKADNAAKAQIINQNQKDAALGVRLANLEQALNDRFNQAVQPAIQTIVRVPDSQICKPGPASAAASNGVMQLRSAYDPGQASGAGKPDGPVRDDQKRPSSLKP